MDSSADNRLYPEGPPLGSEHRVVRISAAGAICAAVAGLIGIPSVGYSVEEWFTPLRVILATIGMILAGSAVTIRYRWPVAWLFASATCLLAGFGLPQSWDTFRLIAFVFAGAALLGAGLAFLPAGARMAVVSALAVVHFLGIFVAVTSPPPSPVLTNYLWGVLYRPYLQFVYLGNAYQFYSPEPGPASEAWFCIYYEPKIDDPVKMEVLQQTPDGQPIKDRNGLPVYKLMTDARGEVAGEPVYDAAGEVIFKEERDRFNNVLKRPLYTFSGDEQKPDYLHTTKWVKLPKRTRDFKDPLGQAYYRRLSITEQLAHFTPMTQYPAAVQTAMTNKRQIHAAQIPLDLNEWPLNVQCRIPNHDITEYILPSYIRFLAKENALPDRRVAAIKAYRVMHIITEPEALVGTVYKGKKIGTRMNDPTTYWPYFLGEFDAKGELLNPNDAMLYWLVPIRRNPGARPEDFEKHPESLADYKRLYEDFVYKHAESNHMEGEFAK